jgi:hypothetical protein
MHHRHQALDHNETDRAVCIDYAKALTSALINVLFRRVFSFITLQRSQRFKLTGCFSECLPLKGSVPQGT